MAETKYVVFRLNQERFGVPIERVDRILPEQSITRVPRSPKMLLGVFDLRGETVPAVDLRTRLEMESRQEPGTFVVVSTPVGRCALRVDGVEGISAIAEGDIDRNPHLADRTDDPFVGGIARQGDRLVVILDSDEIVPAKLRRQILRTQEQPVAA